jgi:hypothetical protein
MLRSTSRAALLALVSSAALSAQTMMPTVHIVANEFSYEAPQRVRAGWTRVVLLNRGHQPHHVVFT